ncbi:MAG: MlaD family protein [Spirochaetota bacterium]
MLGGFGVFAAVVAGQALFQQYDTYFVRYTDASVSGLQTGGTVVYQGVAVGTIESVRIDPQDVRSIIVEIRVQAGTPIKTDVVAQIVPVGITGISEIELAGGTQGADRLEPGSFIPPAPSTMTQVTESARSILQNIDDVLVDISGVLSGIDQASVGSILASVDEMLAQNQETFQSFLTEMERAASGVAASTDEIERLMESMESVTFELEGLVTRNAPRVDEAVVLLRDTMRVASEIVNSSEVQELVASTGEIAAEVEFLLLRNAADIEEAIDTLNDTLRLLNNFAFQINADPSLLVVPEERQ